VFQNAEMMPTTGATGAAGAVGAVGAAPRAAAAMAADGGEGRYRLLVWLLVAALVAGRLWLCGRFELAGDEAYFWLWSRRLAWGYFSKGPGIAALIRFGTALCGDTELGVRLAAVLSSAGASLGIYALGRALCSARVGFWAVVVANTTPLFCAGSLLATADMPSICAWTWGAVLFWGLRRGGSAWRWAGLGLLLGVGTLIRFVVAVEPLCFGLYLLAGGGAGSAGPAGVAAAAAGAVGAGERRRLREPGFWVMLAVMAACLTPWLVWQGRHGWISWENLLARGALDRPWGLHPRAFGEFVALQLAVVLPYGAGALVAYWPRAGRRLPAEAWRYLAALSLPLFAFYAVLALNDAGQPNWTGPAYVAAGLLTVATFLDLGGRSAAVRRLNLAAVAAGAAGAVVLHLALAAVWLPAGRDPLVRVRGGRDLAEQVTAVARRTGAAFLIGSHYQVASLLAFYQADGPGRLETDPREPAALEAWTPCGARPANQLDLWGGYGARWRGRDALYVTTAGGPPEELARQFAAIEALPPVEAHWRGRPVRRYGLYLCRRLLRECGAGAPP
jgi:4-amino-4-deoxy-L-arabinose transferase-like glycosyltransferase